MSQVFSVEIISPKEKIFEGKTEEVILPCYEGQVTILANHIPLITFLRPGLIEIEKNNKFYTEEGTVEFSNDKLIVLSASILKLSDMKSEKIRDMIELSKKQVSDNEISDKQRYLLNHKIDTLKQII